MALVQISGQWWGTVWDLAGNVIDGQLATLDTTVYTAADGLTPLSAPLFFTDTYGRLPGYCAEGNRTLTINGVAFPVQALGGSEATRVAAIEDGTFVFEKLTLANMTLTDEANPDVYALQLAEDFTGTPKGTHVTNGDQLGTGMAGEITINPGFAAGADQDGAALRLLSGGSTGDGDGGAVIIGTSVPGASGSTPNVQEHHWIFAEVAGLPVMYPNDDDRNLLGTTLRWFYQLFVRIISLRSYIEGDEMVDPAAPAANKGRLYFKDVGGKTALCVRFPTGAVQQIAIEP
jgi:hypothetical protein